MLLPVPETTAAQAFPTAYSSPWASQEGDVGSKLREWSSLIGIITAIVGNILISFALNIQRYAHIRLNRDRDGRSKTWKSTANKQSGKGGYGTQQEHIAEERTDLNLNAPSEDEEDSAHRRRYHGDGEAEETAPSRRLYASRSSSESTVKQTEKEDTESDGKTYLSSPYWWAGILLMTVGEAGNFLAYGFAPASIVSPLGVVALVSNCIIAPYLLKERFRQRDFWGVAVAVAGAVTVVLSAKTSETKMGPHDLWVAITRWEFELYLAITAALMVILMGASSRYGERTILIDLGLVGLFGGYTALSTKGVASMLSDSLWRAFTFPITYLLILVLVTTALLQIRYVNRALQRFNSTQVIPTQFVLFTISVIIGSAVLYRDFESATVDRIGKFIGGCLLTFLGVYLITSGRASGDDADDEGEDGEEENTIGLIDEEGYHDELSGVRGGDLNRSRHSSVGAMSDEGKQKDRTSSLSRKHYNGAFSSPRTPRRQRSNVSSASSAPLSPFETPESRMLDNPWLSSEGRSSTTAKRQTLASTISSPLLPSEAQDQRPSTLRAYTHGQPRLQRSSKPRNLSRNSMSRMWPGPLLSPLSSPLSAIVADSLRRGMDSPTRRRLRFSGVQNAGSSKLRGDSIGGEVTLGTSPLKTAEQPEESSGQNPTAPKDKPRSRSISFGDFSRFKNNKGKGHDGNTNDEEEN